MRTNIVKIRKNGMEKNRQVKWKKGEKRRGNAGTEIKKTGNERKEERENGNKVEEWTNERMKWERRKITKVK